MKTFETPVMMQLDYNQTITLIGQMIEICMYVCNIDLCHLNVVVLVVYAQENWIAATQVLLRSPIILYYIILYYNISLWVYCSEFRQFRVRTNLFQHSRLSIDLRKAASKWVTYYVLKILTSIKMELLQKCK